MAISYVASRILDAYPHLDANQIERRLAYASFASVKDRFFYLEVPKAACTAMKMLLRELCHSPELKLFTDYNHRETRRSMFIHVRNNVSFPSLNALDKEDQRDLLESPDVLRFTVVRNPYTRLVSAWRDKVFLCEPGVYDVYTAVRGAAPAMDRKSPIEFAEFVSYIERSGAERDLHWRKQVDLAYPKGIPFTHIGKVEDLQSTLAIFSRHIGRQDALTVPRVNEGSIKPPARYSNELAARVYALYEDDFGTFDYRREAWPHDEEARSYVVSEERFIDEVLERNLIIAHLYNERARLYHYSLARVTNKLRRILGVRDW
jgi:hypothetical protein